MKLTRLLAILSLSGSLWAPLSTLSGWAADAKQSSAFAGYHLADADLKVVGIDTDPTESFLALQLDSAGRLFAGAREALFVYEPTPGGLYQPRKLLYRFPKDSWVYGIAIRGADVYVATHTAVYVLEQAVFKRDNIVPKRLLWDLPMLPYFEEHQGVHAVTFGPEGDLYISIGDNLVGYGDFKRADHWGHWTFSHGTKQTPFTSVGGVMRISPDGNVFNPVARGLRNCCGLAFDIHWNLFGNDNDHESLPEAYVPGRLLNITDHAYFGWPRGWLAEQQPWRADLLDTLNPDLGRYVPTGQAYYHETFLPEKYRDNLLVAEWGKGVMPRYPLQAKGASFKAPEIPFLICTNNVRPVGIAVGRGGRIFVSSLVMAGNEASPIARSEIVMITLRDDAPNAPFSAYEETAAPADLLFSELESESWQRRYRAHTELIRRNNQGQAAAARLAKASSGSALQSSLIWIATAGAFTKDIESLVKSPNATVRLQAVRAFNRYGVGAVKCNLLANALNDTNPQVVHAALNGILSGCESFSLPAIINLAESTDSFIRQTAVQILAEKSTLANLQQLCESSRSTARLAGVLAAGFRLTVPAAVKPLPNDFPLNAGGFSTKVQYAEGIENVAENTRAGVFTIAEAWARQPRTVQQSALFDMLKQRLDDSDQQVVKQAAYFLRLLKDDEIDARVSSLLGITAAVTNNAPIANAKTTGAVDLPEAFQKIDWEKEVTVGDIKAGQELFTARGCAVCHEIKNGDSGGGGPSLAGAGSRFSVEYLLEAIVVPNKTVAPMFRWTHVQLKDGDEFAGLVTGETGQELDLLLPAGIHRVVKIADIEKREIQERSPMPEGLIQTPAELRDLLAFLRAQK